ncbi:hypothetical protein [Kitasatospora sp. NPDC088783]|uniref:hypothetical protein n=1 Tax=Kitasatospora sp. NPDC088783 TaxID=3364077 RepID=UPI00382869CC
MASHTAARTPGPAFLQITSTGVHVHDLAWFEEHWSRESSWGRARTWQLGTLLLLLADGSVHPEPFTVRGGTVLYSAHADGRRFEYRSAELVAASAALPFAYWQANPREGEDPVEDPETAALPEALARPGTALCGARAVQSGTSLACRRSLAHTTPVHSDPDHDAHWLEGAPVRGRLRRVSAEDLSRRLWDASCAQSPTGRAEGFTTAQPGPLHVLVRHRTSSAWAAHYAEADTQERDFMDAICEKSLRTYTQVLVNLGYSVDAIRCAPQDGTTSGAPVPHLVVTHAAWAR